MKNLFDQQKRNKCQCGKTKDSNGNCDGSHANKRIMLKSIVLILSILFSTLSNAITITPKNDKEINIKNSSVSWKGEKVTGSHEGTIMIKSGFLKFEKKKLIGGEFEIDMTSLVCTDLSGEYKGKLEGHLKADDFFGVASYPEATLTIKEINAQDNGNYSVVGDFTIKGITQSVPFTIKSTADTFVADVTIDRSKHNVRYGSGSFFDNLGNKAISDDFKLTVTLKL